MTTPDRAPSADPPAPAPATAPAVGTPSDKGRVGQGSEQPDPAPQDAEPPRAPADWRNGLVMAAVLVLIGVAVWLVLVSRFRRAATVLAAALFLVGLARLVLPTRRMGPLAVRSRGFDVAFTFVLGALLSYLVAIE